MKILVIFTGGTIGSVKKDGWISTDALAGNSLIDGYKKHSQVSFSTLSPYTVHSEKLSSKELNLLIDCLFKNKDNGYDGIIVTHGTDTLQYSAAAAGYCLGSDTPPVVFVSSNYPLEDKRANGRLNFEAAVEFLFKKAGRGVFVSYSNDLKTADIHLATRLLKNPELSDKVFSVGDTPYAMYVGGELKVLLKERTVEKGLGNISFCKDPGILQVPISPFQDYVYDLDRFKAVVLIPYHSGTVNTDDVAFKKLCERAKEKNIPVFLPDIPKESCYDSMRTYKELGITALAETPFIPLVIKLWLEISRGADIRNFSFAF